MYRNPLVVGVNTAALQGRKLALEQQLSMLGNNTGNMLFAESLFSVLRHARRSDFHFTPAQVEGCDCIVVAAANWVNPHSDFGDLADRIEKTGLPVFVSGLGAQASLDRSIPTLKPGTDRLLRLMAESSRSLSVRGAFTAEVLASYGITNVRVTGCPSLLLAGRQGPALRRGRPITAASSVVHSTRHLFNLASPFQTWLYREALRQQTDLLLQSELADLYYATGRLNNPTLLERCDAVLPRAFGGADIDAVRAYLKAHGRVFWTLPEWLHYAAGKAFFVGTRIHGTIAALLAGTPATLIAHDARTLEMAEAMAVPYVLAEQLDPRQPLDLEALHRPEALEAFVANYPAYRQRFEAFFAENGLALNESGATEPVAA